MGFDQKWVDAIMECVTSVSYSVAINGQIGEKFFPSRGLRQGDPLSQFLFLVCGEGLSSLLRLAMNGSLLKEVKVCRRGPQISHLLFVDDCILFGDATSRGASLFKEILCEYKACSGQSVNFEKSTLFFSTNTSEDDRRLVVNLLGVRSSNDLKRYLGLPNMVGRRKKESFQNLKDRLMIIGVTELGSLPSLTWKSIWVAKGLLQKGMCWRVDRGDKISIWEDSWIQGIDIIDRQNVPYNGELQLVSDLTDNTNRKWKTDLINSTFRGDITQKILLIPLADTVHKDIQVWKGESDFETVIMKSDPGRNTRNQSSYLFKPSAAASLIRAKEDGLDVDDGGEEDDEDGDGDE
ncbi:uncharacterized protein [Gossypium hirsutum]|uniref:Reverse transcriptase domain-containing protein n=1 Tax=Gossypium hirsutum TaxID=3635 RepID=A0ABM3BW92_GOSHI|nr:uncharacterized protein LOC121230487 [Gossypium hirsutum]